MIVASGLIGLGVLKTSIICDRPRVQIPAEPRLHFYHMHLKPRSTIRLEVSGNAMLK